jgi:hypothetical protein
MLEELSPREFEEYCQVLFMHFFRCRVELTPATGDEGRDLLLHRSQGLVVVECKHYPNGTVGRPVVQKLHSAVLTASAHEGMIVTTGRFSQEAQDYTSKLGDVKIELVDAAKLAFFISQVFPAGTASEKLAGATLTTSDDDFPGLFVKSVFARSRYRRPVATPTDIKVRRTTTYVPYFLASFRAEGSRTTARGPISGSWSGNAWIRGDGGDAGIGPPPSQASEQPRSSLGTALTQTPGKVQPPLLQPHEALARMREFLAGTLRKKESYFGRNNQLYSVTVQPSVNKVQLDSLAVCYFPVQQFSLRVGPVTHEGHLTEEATAFHVTCNSLSTCVICGGETSQRNQVLCAICFKPAHRWSLFSPDSFECERCKAWVCRNDIRRLGRSRICRRCEPQAKPLRNRFVPFLLLALFFSCGGLILALAIPWSQFFWGVLLAAVGWIPFSVAVLRPSLSIGRRELIYSKEVSDSGSDNGSNAVRLDRGSSFSHR